MVGMIMINESDILTLKTLKSVFDDGLGSPALLTRVGAIEEVEVKIGRVNNGIPPNVNLLETLWLFPKWSVEPDENQVRKKT